MSLSLTFNFLSLGPNHHWTFFVLFELSLISPIGTFSLKNPCEMSLIKKGTRIGFLIQNLIANHLAS